MTNKIDTVLKAITDRIAGTLPSDMVKNPKLSTSPVLSARSYPTEDPQCSTYVYGLINTIMIHPKQQNDSRDSMAEEEKQEREATPKTPTPLHTLKNKEIRHCWNVEEPLDLVDISEELVYESLIKEMPKCSLNYDFRIKKGEPRNLKIPCMIVLGVLFCVGVSNGDRGECGEYGGVEGRVGRRVDGDVAYKLDLPEELSRVQNTFHVSNLKKCHADEPLAVLLDGLHFDDKLHFVEEPVEILVGEDLKKFEADCWLRESEMQPQRSRTTSSD
nr:putative reverse transcriptase domain-containing protein [Tanacetum cinerariifolium]